MFARFCCVRIGIPLLAARTTRTAGSSGREQHSPGTIQLLLNRAVEPHVYGWEGCRAQRDEAAREQFGAGPEKTMVEPTRQTVQETQKISESGEREVRGT